jgi:UDPglucose--hexose-1-phosphate uridylyltransferase
VLELRRDDLTGELVLVAPGRAARPHTSAARTGTPPAAADCPFCPGHESATPPEVARIGGGPPNEPGWQVRAFPNLYPFVGGVEAGLRATGAHEVVVLSPSHDDLSRLGDDAASQVLRMLRDRSHAHADGGHAYVQVAVNQGREAGASIAHPHAQVVALDFVPPAVDEALARFAAAGDDLVRADHGRAEREDGLVLARDGVAAWCGPGSSTPYEVRLAALGAGARFATATDAELTALALALRDSLRRLAAVLDDPPYNVVLHDAPARGEPRYHWWVRVLPRVVVPAGFELGTGVLVQPVDPRDAAAQLRSAST